MGSNDYERGLNDGVELENARLAPLHAALLEAVEELEFVYDFSMEPVIVNRVSEIFAKIDEALKHG